jgi:outer membrane protein OmpA-like peptidoglycan-associated protein
MSPRQTILYLFLAGSLSTTNARPQTHLATTITVHFESNQSSLSPASGSIIDSYFRTSAPARLLTIAGYCDNTGAEPYNNQLSLNRAQTVNDYIHRHWPDSTTNIHLTAYGTRYPVADNNTAPGRALNRRVTIIFAASVPHPNLHRI